jgi:hypothetical protein
MMMMMIIIMESFKGIYLGAGGKEKEEEERGTVAGFVRLENLLAVLVIAM